MQLRLARRVLVPLLIGAAVCLGLPLSASAIGSITQGGVTFAYTNDFTSSRGDTVDTSFTGAATGNQTFESWWFFRVSGDGSETAFATPDSENYAGSIANLQWADPGSAGLFSAILGIEVFDNGSNSGNLFQGMQIANTSGTNLTIDIFHYTDLEVGGNFASDSGVLTSSASGIQIDVTDGSDTAPIIGYGADRYWVTDYSARRSVLANLTDGNVDNFRDRGLPFNNGDITVGFQWSRTLAAGETDLFLTQFGSNAVLLPPSVTNVPEPSAALLIALGLVALAGQRPRPILRAAAI